MAEDDLTEKNLTRWLTPREARTVAMASLGDTEFKSGQSLLEAIAAGLIGVAASSSGASRGRGSPQQKDVPTLIPAKYWDAHLKHGESDFWNGRVSFRLPSSDYGSPETHLRCFRLKLNPDHVAREFPGPRQAAAPAAIKPDRKGWPQPAPAHLEAWFKVFRAAYPRGSEDDAMASAEGMFPDKWIVRQRVRDLMGPGQMGRPSGKKS